MESILKKVFAGKSDDDSHRYFVRFGKGEYARRFLISFARGKTIKMKASFEFANDLVKFVRENSTLKFSGKVLTKDKVAGREGKKKAGVFVYELEQASLEEFENAYFYLLDANNSDLILKIKKSLPKPGKDAEKIDDKFCALEADVKYWPKLKEVFFWDAPEAKRAEIEHTLKITDIILPKDEKDPAKVREKAKRKGVILRKITADGKETLKEMPVEA